MFNILNGYGNFDSKNVLEIKESKITRGHNFTLVKKQSRLERFHFPRGPYMCGINYQHSMYMPIVLLCSRIE